MLRGNGHNTKLFLLLAGLCGLVAVEMFGLWLLMDAGYTSRIIIVDDLDLVSPKEDIGADLEWTNRFTASQPRDLLKEVTSFVTKVGAEPSGDAATMIMHIENGGGLICSGMAKVYASLANAKGLQSRRIMLTRHLFNRFDTHQTVEILYQNRWVIFDPTFSVSYALGGQLLGAGDVQKALLNGDANEIVLIEYKKNTYPASLEQYYMDWPLLFNNVFVIKESTELWRKMPPMRYWYGPTRYAGRIDGISNEHIHFANMIYFVFWVMLPLVMVGYFIFLLYFVWFSKNHKFQKRML